MLRGLEFPWAGGPRRMDRDGAKLARRTAEFIALAGVMALLCKAQPAPGLAPFAMAFFSAALLAGLGTAALLAGCLIGALNGVGQPAGVELPVGAAIALGGSLAGELLLPPLLRRLGDWRRGLWDALSRHIRLPGNLGRRVAMRPAPEGNARSPNREYATCALLAGLATLVPGLVRAGGAHWPSEQFYGSVQALTAALAAVGCAPFLRAALDARPLKRTPSIEQRMGLSLLACMLTAGLAKVFMPAALICSAVAMLWVYPWGALAGAAMGAALLLMGGDPRLACVLAAGGSAAQLCAKRSRRAREGAAFAALTGAALALNLPIIYVAAAGVSALIAMLLPGRWLEAAAAWARPDPARDPLRLAARRLRAMGAAFGDLAEGWRDDSAPQVPAQFGRARALLFALAARIADDRTISPGPRLRAETAAMAEPREAGTPSGDSHAVRLLEDGRLLALICDGMGSGEAAARESALAVRLLGRLLAAGAERTLAVETANALLMDRGGEDMFATADVLIADLRTGEAELIKLAAAPTLLARDGEARWIGGGRLPLGIVEGARPGIARLRLRPGDALLMASDGVADAAGRGALEEVLLRDLPAREAARLAMEAAMGGEHPDDRTVVVIRIGNRH